MGEETLMAIIAKRQKSEFTPAPEGLHAAICCDVVDLGMEQSPWGQLHKIQIRWQIDEINPKTQKRFIVVRKFTLSLAEKSNLLPILEAWRGKKFTKQELDGFDLEKLVGANCQVQVVHNIKSEDEVYANVQAVVPPARNAVKLQIADDYVREIEREKRARLEANPDDEYEVTDEDIPF